MELTTIKEFCSKYSLLEPQTTVIVGLSGGPDSVCLLHILAQLQGEYSIKLIAAHLDHQWRVESHEDMLFCKNIAENLNIPFVWTEASTLVLDKKYNGSQEEWGRLLRRYYLESVAQTYKATHIALGHHADDQEETFFIRLLRGATVAGLASMRPKTGLYIRPLLAVHKSWILNYLQHHNLIYRNDSTNEQETYLRNRIRHTVLPALRACDKRFDKSFTKTITALQETDDFLEKITCTLFSSMIHEKDTILWIDKNLFFAADPFLYPRLVVHWLCTANVPFTPTNPFLDEIIRFLEQPGSSIHKIHPSWSLVKKKNLVGIIIL